MQIIDESPAEFPTVSICDSNPFTTFKSQLVLDSMMQQLTQNKVNTSLSLNQLGFYNFYLLQSNTKIYPSIDLYRYALDYIQYPDNFTDAQRKELGLDLSQVVSNCTFNGIDCDINNDFEWFFSHQYGNCYHFNPSQIKNKVCLIKKSVIQISILTMGVEQKIRQTIKNIFWPKRPI